MKFKLLIIPALFFSLLFFSTCEFHSEEELYGLCDTLDMTYSKVKYIFKENCYSCHSVTLATNDLRTDTYIELKNAVNGGKLWGAINHLEGYPQMPNGQPKLDDCQIAKIGAWINAGMPE